MKKIISYLKILTILVISSRFASLFFNVLIDSTESRYAEVGRKMLETGNYITPFIDVGIPFWGKPPLSFWSNALSYKLFGVNEFAAHLPPFLFLLGVVVLIYFFTKNNFDELTAWVSALILSSCTIFLYLMGGVMTDPALVFCIALAIISFWNALHCEKKSLLWGYLFFTGIGLALLAKGPMCLPLIGFPILIWVIMKNKWKEIWQKIPWVSGTILMLAISLPWYILAEKATPGFLRYFIIGEHFERFLIPHWSGDLYGEGRGGFRGIVWVFYLMMLAPWSLIAIMQMVRKFLNKSASTKTFDFSFLKDDRLLFLFLWTLCPLAFFTLSSNTLIAYAAPVMAPTAVLFAHYICLSPERLNKKMFVWVASINIFIFLSGAILGLMANLNPHMAECASNILKSDKFVLQTYYKNRSQQDTPLLYLTTKRFSADFYSQGKAVRIQNAKKINPYLETFPEVFVVVYPSHLVVPANWENLDKEILFSTKKRTLLRVKKKI